MLRNYLKITVRNLLKHKTYSLINIVGLAIGFTCCFLILLFVHDELSYDRYHKNAHQIYRVITKFRIGETETQTAFSSTRMAETLVNEFPEVMQATRLMGAKNVLIRYNDKRFNESRFLYADSTAFEVFTIPLIQGSPQTALTQPNSIVITKTTAKKYFGEEGPMGKTLIMNDWAEYKITGIAEDVPHNSHFHFDFLASLATLEYSRNKTWFSLNLYTYVVLQENYSPAQTEAKFPELIRKYVAPDIHMMMGISVDEFLSSGGNFEFFLQPLLDIHLHSNLLGELEANSDAVYVYIFFVIAIFILVIACINYINLATARSARRAKEVGVRKVLGSLRSQLVKQFLGESVLLSMIAVFLCNSSRRISPSRFQRAYWQENGDQLFRN